MVPKKPELVATTETERGCSRPFKILVEEYAPSIYSKLVERSRQSTNTPGAEWKDLPVSRLVESRTISRRGSRNCSGRIITAFTTLNTAVFAPIPKAKVRTETTVKPGLLRIILKPKRTS